jgi:hypothetical protein
MWQDLTPHILTVRITTDLATSDVAAEVTSDVAAETPLSRKACQHRPLTAASFLANHPIERTDERSQDRPTQGESLSR